MKVALASTWAEKCGISTYSLHLAKALIESIDVIVYSEDPEIPGLDTDQTEGLNIESKIAFSRNDKDFNGIYNVAESDDVDILHIQHETSIFGFDNRIKELIENCENNGIRTVVTLHSTPMIPKYRQDILDLLPCSRIIVHTEPALKYWNDPKVVKINHGCIPLNINVNKKELRTKLGLDPEALYIATTGYIGDLKGFKELIDILPEVRKDYPNAKLLFIGGIHPATKEWGSQYITDLAKVLKKNNLTSKDVVITGWIPESKLGDYLLTPDLYVLNYKMSGLFSATGTGARVVGTNVPLICADNTGRLEELVDGKTCLKYPSGKALNAIQIILKSPDLAKKLATNAYEYSQLNQWSEIAKQHVKLYEELE